MWDIKFKQDDRKKYLHLIAYIKGLIEERKLTVGQSLPTQRVLAQKLGLSIGTITKAFKELEDEGYIQGEVGRGTFVRDISKEFEDFFYTEEKLQTELDLGHFRNTELIDHVVQANLMEGIKETVLNPQLFFRLNDLLTSGTPTQKAAFIKWLDAKDARWQHDDLLITGSTTHSISVCLNTLVPAKGTVLLEALCNPMYKDAVLQQRLNPVGVPMDDQGIEPQQLNALCQKHRPSLLITNPTLHNPTTITTPKSRKQQIAEICQKYQVKVLEIGVLDAFKAIKPWRYVDFQKDNLYATSFSKAINPALRVGLLICKDPIVRQKLEMSSKLSIWTNSHLLNEIAAHLVNSGRALKILNARQVLAQERVALFKQAFPKRQFNYGVDGFHAWLCLPQPWTSSQFTQQAYNHGLLVRNVELFQVSQQPIGAYLRISLGAITATDKYQKAIQKLKELISNGPLPTLTPNS